MSGIYRDKAPLRDSEPTDGGSRQEAAGPVPITVIEPEGNARGGIVVLHESRKFADVLLDMMKSLAGEGWIMVAPNLFHRVDQPATVDGAEPGTPAVEHVFGADLFADFDACFDWLVGRGVFADTIGILGFDQAGTAALLVATNRPIGAAVSVAAPGITAPLTADATALLQAAPDLQAPWLGLYGDDDPTTPADDVERLRDAAARAAVATLVVSYPGLHHRPDHPGFEMSDFEQLAEEEKRMLIDAQTRIFDWFDSHLR
ncbi:putative carboxymethylenebutenolidase [Nocardia nova SH22a]|uniref:Putative carboxymethylenebutenolidase n=1 Tax=Nocardia nova SH22a TaxID=1415166 RepID=W5T7R8_9NOCA|nr:dienelactone hydrolase family protein [Nocardia nova]AHH15008.1 putative carboxymethylenebutenolidase [Nocardia nova SH22a]